MRVESGSRLLFITSLVLIWLCFLPQRSLAEDKYWIGETSWWDYASNWSPTGQPSDGDYVYLTQSDATNRTVYYRNTAYPSVQLFWLEIDATGSGTMTLSQDQDQLAAYYEYIGNYGKGAFTQSGGTNEMTGLYLGYSAGASGSYELSGGSLSLTGDAYLVEEIIGYSGTGIFTQSGGTNNVTYDPDSPNDGLLIIGYNTGANGSYSLSGTGSLIADSEIVGGRGTGTFTQSGGTNTVFSLDVALNAGVSGSYDLSGGSLTATQELIGHSGTGTFNQSGGTNTITWGLNLGTFDEGSGSYNLSGGSLTAQVEVIGSSGTGTFNQSGGTNTTDFLEIAVNAAGNSGTYHLSGGTLDAGHILNNGVFNYTGGSLSTTTPATFENHGTFNLSGGGVRTVEGNVENYGTVKATDTTAVFAGTFTNEGAYISDPSMSYFNDLIVGETGYLQGESDDYFYIFNDFINQSGQNNLWDTGEANLGFITGPDSTHNFYLTGADYGSLFSGYEDNFAWGSLDLTGQTLDLYDGNATDGGALYLGAILGAELSDGQATNIFGNALNIYYLASLPENAYLGGLTYDLQNGGKLVPVPVPAVPLPPSVLILASGLAGLIGFRKRFRR